MSIQKTAKDTYSHTHTDTHMGTHTETFINTRAFTNRRHTA